MKQKSNPNNKLKAYLWHSENCIVFVVLGYEERHMALEVCSHMRIINLGLTHFYYDKPPGKPFFSYSRTCMHVKVISALHLLDTLMICHYLHKHKPAQNVARSIYGSHMRKKN